MPVVARVLAVYLGQTWAREGGFSYGLDYGDLFRRATTNVDRILRGAKPAELPFNCRQNLRWPAKALGLTVPQSILLRADEVIQ